MRSTVSAVVALLVVGAGSARADTPERRYGLMADMGLPDGFVGSFVYRPHRRALAHAGIGHNLNGFGLRVGGKFLPMLSTVPVPVAPYVAVEAGHFFRSRTPDWMRETAKDAGLDDKTLTRLGYTFANAHVGVELGTGSARFYLQGGISFVRAGTDIIKPKPKITPPVDLYRETVVHLWILGGHTGLLYYF